MTTEWTKKKKGGEIARVAGRREKFETSVCNYSVRTTFEYPSLDREISQVAGRAQEDGECRGKTNGRRAKKRKGHEVQEGQKKREEGRRGPYRI